ncbi:MAG: sulfite exporter TauE/SafE family protein [bacterium]|nr:sulfite exporter TauE/SafE family protein [bacterium]
MQIIYISLLTILASTIGTVTGFGTSTIMVPVLLLFFPLPQTLLLVGIIHFFGDIWKLTLFKRKWLWKVLLGFGIPGVIASFFGAKLIFSLPANLITKIIGGILVAYGIFIIINPVFKLAINYLTSIIGGVTSGFLAGFGGVGGALRGLFLSAYDLPKSTYIFTSGAIAFAIDSTRITTYFANGTRLDSLLTVGLLIFIPASFMGAKIAQKIVSKISQRQLRITIAIFLLIVGVKLIFF